MRWNSYTNNDALALEYTPNFNNVPGGFLVDPNSSYGKFAVSLGKGSSRNVALFSRPSAGLWHHYEFVLNTTAPAAEQITPYVDGQPVAVTKAVNGTGAGNFANSVLYFMSRAGTSLFGAGDLDEVAIYGRALDPATIAEHYESHGTNRRPVAAFAGPTTAKPGQQVTLDASASSDPDGSIVDYQWDLDGNGSFETDTGSTPTATHTYSAEGSVNVGLRVTDNQTGTDAVTHSLSIIANQAPSASFSASPNPVLVGTNVTFDASASSDPDGSIAHYEWDLDGNGTFETDGGSSRTVTRSYASAGTVNVGLRVTDNGGNTATTSSAAHGQTQLRRRRAQHPGPAQLLADGRGKRPDLGRQHRVKPGHNGRRGEPGRAGGASGRPEHGGPLRRAEWLRRSADQPLVDQPGHGRVLVALELLHEQRRPCVRVHLQLQQRLRRLPGRPEQQLRQVCGFSRQGRFPQRRSVQPAERRPVAPLCVRAQHDRAGRRTDHPICRRPGRAIYQAEQRHRCRQLRQLRALLHVARRNQPLRSRGSGRGRGLRARA